MGGLDIIGVLPGIVDDYGLTKVGRTLQKHVEKLSNLRYKSQVKGTIYRVKQQIDTIKQFIKDKEL